MKRTVLQMLKTASEKYANTTYTCEKTEKGWTPKTFLEVEQDSNYAGAYLLQNGFQKEDKIAILSEGRTDWIVGEYSILKAGGISVPLSIKLLPEEILFRLNHSEARGIIVSSNTFPKILPIWDKISEQNVTIYYLDNNIEEVQNKISAISENAEDQIVAFSEVVKKGKEIYTEDSIALEKSINAVVENDVATISYTSGTTGNPKGIMLTQLNYYSNSNEAMDMFQLPEFFKTLVILPIDHAFAHTVGIYISLLKGISIYFVDARGGGMNALKNIPINLKEVQPDFLLTVPALTGNFMNKMVDGIRAKGGFIHKLFEKGLKAGMEIHKDGYRKASFLKKAYHYPVYKLANALIFKKLREVFGGKLQFCVGGGALLDIKQQKFFYAIGTPVYQGYGLTEATPIISSNIVRLHKLGTSGIILGNLETKIVDANRNELPKGQKGELVIRGENVMAGYYKNEEASAEVLEGGWLYTGDMGYIDEDDFLMIVGREKALLISEDGEKYSPEGIEEAIVNVSPAVAQVMIYNDHKKFTTGIVTLNVPFVKSRIQKKNIKDADALLNYITKSFYKFNKEKEYANQHPQKWVPKSFTIVKEPFTEQNNMINSTMKMVRNKITEHYQQEIDNMYTGNPNDRNKEVLREMFGVE